MPETTGKWLMIDLLSTKDEFIREAGEIITILDGL